MSYYYTQVFKRHKPTLLKVGGSINELIEDFKKTNLLICGESHGVRENADIAYTLCKTLSVKQLAIERSASKFEPFIQSAINGNPNFLLPQVMPSLQASVLSIEMLKTIVTLIDENSITDIKYVDLDSTNNPALSAVDPENYMKVREREIAKNITTLDTSVLTLVLLGNYHTRKQADKVVGQSALQLVRQVRSATYLQYQYLSGSQYNAGRLLHFPAPSVSKKEVVRSSYRIKQQSEGNFTIDIPKAHRILV